DAPPAARHPLEYLVYLSLDDAVHQRLCSTPVLPTVRAVLAWNVVPPSDPNWDPPYGNRRDADIQVAPRQLIVGDLLAGGGILERPGPAADALAVDASLALVAPKPVPFGTLAEQAAAGDVPHHRLLYPALGPLLAGTAANELVAQPTAAELEKLGIDLS